jgi:hypothetical protein
MLVCKCITYGKEQSLFLVDIDIQNVQFLLAHLFDLQKIVNSVNGET